MTRCSQDALRERPQRHSRTRARPARLVGPALASLAIQVVAVAVTVMIGLPVVAIVLIVIGIGLLGAFLTRRAVSSLVAGAGMLVAQPYATGERVRLFVPSLDSVETAEIVRVGPVNTTLMTRSGIVLVPNTVMLRDAASTH